ncbi:DUF6692 family protein [Microvirga roseola]|uniref:DUF6692 family protein n=1 Tax=Microvirga roseola TaxID=2883126 RepID=UPI001E39BD95|nr:DUF6692 family protein [Microvirga roseola]
MRALSSQGGQARLALVAAFGLLVAGCSESEAPDDDLSSIRAPEITRIMPASEALTGAHIPSLDPAPMVDAAIQKALGAGPRCEFRYTTAGRPVLAAGMQPDGTPSGGIVKLNGSLVPLGPVPVDIAAGPEGLLLLAADPVRVAVMPIIDDEAEEREGLRRQEATMIFEVGQELRVGYRGYLDCGSGPPVRSSRR